jgi:erythromycin esterase-like protein
LRDVQAVALRADAGGGCLAADEPFFAEQNARLVKNAETYYRAMFLRDVASWNVRDSHMAETLDALVAHLGRDGTPPKVVVWAHNSHLGDARATEMARRGELNLGQLVRERHGRRAVLVGFTTDHGFVTAADDWGGTARRKAVRPALAGSYEHLFHASGEARFLVRLRHDGALPDALQTPRLERAIGVIYRPQTERASHYFHADLARQFDVVLHFDATRAVEPLDPAESWSRPDADDAEDVAETWPTGI